MVSPTLQSATDLIEAVRKPISPGPSSDRWVIFGVKAPTLSTGGSAPVAIMRTFMPGFSVPSITRTRVMTPR